MTCKKLIQKFIKFVLYFKALTILLYLPETKNIILNIEIQAFELTYRYIRNDYPVKNFNIISN